MVGVASQPWTTDGMGGGFVIFVVVATSSSPPLPNNNNNHHHHHHHHHHRGAPLQPSPQEVAAVAVDVARALGHRTGHPLRIPHNFVRTAPAYVPGPPQVGALLCCCARVQRERNSPGIFQTSAAAVVLSVVSN